MKSLVIYLPQPVSLLYNLNIQSTIKELNLEGDDIIYSQLAVHTLRDQIQKIELCNNQQEQLYKILEVYMDLFPVKNAYLFRFSPMEYLGEGIISLQPSGFILIRDIRDDIRSLPAIYSAVRERKAKFCTGMEFFLQNISVKYNQTPPISSLAVTPICFGNITIGYICSTVVESTKAIDDEMLNSLTLYGQLVGKVLETPILIENPTLLSKREMEVMRRIAKGQSTKEMADSMSISELTVNQYVKSAVKKLGAFNRAHAVAELFRKGMMN